MKLASEKRTNKFDSSLFIGYELVKCSAVYQPQASIEVNYCLPTFHMQLIFSCSCCLMCFIIHSISNHASMLSSFNLKSLEEGFFLFLTISSRETILIVKLYVYLISNVLETIFRCFRNDL